MSLAKRNRLTAAFLGFCGLLLCLLAFGFGQVLKVREHQLQADIDAAFFALTATPNTQRGMEPIIARRVMDDQAATREPFTRMFAASQASLLDQVFRYCFTQGIRLESFDLDDESIQCKGEAESPDELKALKELLEQANFEVQVDQQAPAPQVAFTLTGKVMQL